MEVSKEVLRYISVLIPSGLDSIQRAIDMSKIFGEDERWAVDSLLRNMTDLGYEISELNPVHGIYLEIGSNALDEFKKFATDKEIYVDDANIIDFDDLNKIGFGLSDKFVANMQKLLILSSKLPNTKNPYRVNSHVRVFGIEGVFTF